MLRQEVDTRILVDRRLQILDHMERLVAVEDQVILIFAVIEKIVITRCRGPERVAVLVNSAPGGSDSIWTRRSTQPADKATSNAMSRQANCFIGPSVAKRIRIRGRAV